MGLYPVEVGGGPQPGGARKVRADPVYLSLVGMVGTRRLRPLARRRERTFRPPTVLILARKPWHRFRFNLLGW